MKLPGARRDASMSGWAFSHTGEIVQMPPDHLHAVQEGSQQVEVRHVPRAKLDAGECFDKIIALDQPLILEGLDIGPCTSKWSLDYLTTQIGGHRKVGESKSCSHEGDERQIC